MDSLKRLEYRGYDSAGVATLEGEHLARRRAEGKLAQSRARAAGRAAAAAPSASATPAGPRTARRPRATPTRTPTERVAVVHNGIIENFRELRERARARRAHASPPRPTPRSSPTWSTHASGPGQSARSRRSRRRCRGCDGAFAHRASCSPARTI
ncbi:MAG: hypothetical protein MZV49_02405 [Rhodopseudomonas palustris]|nr:hypothetical protein [Rhodopseudomonas palustris]